MSNEISLGNIDLKAGPPVSECSKCGSRDIKEIPGEVSGEYISEFIRTRAQRLGIALIDYDIHVDKSNGKVTLTPKDVQLEFDFS